jgi:hypothetical protein
LPELKLLAGIRVHGSHDLVAVPYRIVLRKGLKQGIERGCGGEKNLFLPQLGEQIALCHGEYVLAEKALAIEPVHVLQRLQGLLLKEYVLPVPLLVPGPGSKHLL